MVVPSLLVECEATFVLQELANGLRFLHGRRIIHSDLKLENVVVASERRERAFIRYSVLVFTNPWLKGYD